MFYEELFERNYGIFSGEEQERIKTARVSIVGTGGIGGVVAVALARSGLGHFVLQDYDMYQPSNMNRQITCFTDTLGNNKASTTGKSIQKINPEAEVEVCELAVTPDEIDEVILRGGVFLPAADDWALSITMLDRAKQLEKPAIMAYPVGALGRVSTFLPQSPYAAECVAIPSRLSYTEMKAFMEDPLDFSLFQFLQAS